MKTIFLTFERPDGTKPISVTDIRLMSDETDVSICNIVPELNDLCAVGYAQSIGASVTPVRHINKMDASFFSLFSNTFDERIIFGVLSGPLGPNGYHIDYYVPDTKAA